MTPQEIEQKVIEIIAEQLDIEATTITRNTVLQGKKRKPDLDVDSLDLTEFNMALTETFNIDIPDADWEKLETIGEVIDYVIRAPIVPPSNPPPPPS